MSIYQGKVLTSSDLFWYILNQDNEFVDVNSITFEIALVATPLVLIVPATPATNFGTGKYYASYTIADNFALDDYIITWRWKLTALSTEQSDSEEFTVISPTNSSKTIPPNIELYITAQELIDEVQLTQNKPTEAKALSTILFIQEYIEKITEQFFNIRTLTINLNGNGRRLLYMPYPIIDISKIEFKDSYGVFTEQLLTDFDIYNRILPNGNDDRELPKIECINGLYLPDKNLSVRITGRFGYLNESLQTPEPIKNVTKMLCMIWFQDTDTNKGNMRKSKVHWDERDNRIQRISEKILYGNLTGDAEIDNILRLYTRNPSVSLV